MKKQIYMPILLAYLLSLFPADSSLADTQNDESSRKCISPRNVKRTEVVDDQMILFFARGKKVYINILPKECKGLSRDRRFSYDVSVGRLCKLDRIWVLRETGNHVQRGRSCRLGQFYPTTKKEIPAFIDALQKQPVPQPLPPPGPVDIISEPDQPQESTPN